MEVKESATHSNLHSSHTGNSKDKNDNSFHWDASDDLPLGMRSCTNGNQVARESNNIPDRLPPRASINLSYSPVRPLRRNVDVIVCDTTPPVQEVDTVGSVFLTPSVTEMEGKRNKRKVPKGGVVLSRAEYKKVRKMEENLDAVMESYKELLNAFRMHGTGHIGQRAIVEWDAESSGKFEVTCVGDRSVPGEMDSAEYVVLLDDTVNSCNFWAKLTPAEKRLKGLQDVDQTWVVSTAKGDKIEWKE
eukprot:CAMPEP_0182452150 /NCGR_PEP_ID=MMETSP1172-20130603/44097_1 /TAXON_ID=708627 /ORGANISM="Timspurckia oligopyrenoides, Strain CCMP3278" /LENGTH=245 /DNA_ID=CAMNT_0024649967 /DNA_START=1386 /DNA_END=2123 /DNA_ORIENTATION=+